MTSVLKLKDFHKIIRLAYLKPNQDLGNLLCVLIEDYKGLEKGDEDKIDFVTREMKRQSKKKRQLVWYLGFLCIDMHGGMRI